MKDLRILPSFNHFLSWAYLFTGERKKTNGEKMI